MKEKKKIDKKHEMTVEEVYAEYVTKDITDDFVFGKVTQRCSG